MALTPEQYRAIASSINEFYGEEVIDLQGNLEEQVRAYASEKLKEYEAKIDQLENSEAAQKLGDFFPPETGTDEEGTWDEETAIRFQTIFDTIQLAQNPDLEAALEAEGQNPELANLVRELVQEIETQNFNLEEMGVIASVNATLTGVDMAVAAQAEFDQAYAQSTQTAGEFRDWLVANREAINTLIDGSSLADELKETIKIPEDIPTGEIKLQNPVIVNAFASMTQIYGALAAENRQGEFPAGLEEVNTKLAPLTPLIEQYLSVYTLNPGAQISEDVNQFQIDYAVYDFKVALQQVDQKNIFSDVPDFDIKVDTFNPTETNFIKAWAVADKHIQDRLGPILSNPAITPELHAQLAQIPTISGKINALGEANLIPEADQEAMVYAIQLLQKIETLPVNAQMEIGRQVAATNTQAQASQQQETTLSIPQLFQQFTPEFRTATRAVEMAFRNRLGAPLEPLSVQLLDHHTRHEIENVVTSAFKQHGEEFYSDEPSIVILGADGETYYTFDEDGYIYIAEISDDATIKKNAFDAIETPRATTATVTGGTITRGKQLGDITMGIHVRDHDGHVRKHPHEATTAFMQWLSDNVRADNVPQPTQADRQRIQEEQEELTKNLDELIAAFFVGMPDGLETEFRAELDRSNGQNKDAFLESDIVKRVRENSKKSEVDTTDFLIASFAFERDLTRLDSDPALQAAAGEYSSIFNLFRVMSGNDFNGIHNEMRNQVGQIRDNILGLSAYEVLRHAQGGEHIDIEALHAGATEEQKAAILKYFDGETRATREEVYEYVSRQVKLRAIATLGDEHTWKEIQDMELEDQNKLLEDPRNIELLKGVSNAMYEGKFNPYEKDLDLVFKSFPRPDYTNSVFLEAVMVERESGYIPKPAYFLNGRNATDDELAAMTGNANFKSLDIPTKESLLEDLMAKTPAEALRHFDSTMSAEDAAAAKAAYTRTTVNYYESDMANFTWYRNGEEDGSTPNTWNSTFGTLDNDRLVDVFIRYEWNHLDRIFGDKADIAQEIFMNGNAYEANYGIGYDEAMRQIEEKMGPEYKAILTRELENLHRPSMYGFLTHTFSDRYEDRSLYFEIRNDHYIPALKDAAIQASLTPTEPTPTEDGPDGPGEEDGPDGPDGPEEDEGAIVVTIPEGAEEQNTPVDPEFVANLIPPNHRIFQDPIAKALTPDEDLLRKNYPDPNRYINADDPNRLRITEPDSTVKGVQEPKSGITAKPSGADPNGIIPKNRAVVVYDPEFAAQQPKPRYRVRSGEALGPEHFVNADGTTAAERARMNQARLEPVTKVTTINGEPASKFTTFNIDPNNPQATPGATTTATNTSASQNPTGATAHAQQTAAPAQPTGLRKAINATGNRLGRIFQAPVNRIKVSAQSAAQLAGDFKSAPLTTSWKAAKAVYASKLGIPVRWPVNVVRAGVFTAMHPVQAAKNVQTSVVNTSLKVWNGGKNITLATARDIHAIPGDIKARPGVATLGAATAGISWYHALSNTEDGNAATLTRSTIATMDTMLARDMLRANPSVFSRNIMKTGGALVAITTAAEIGIHVHNKDSNAAGAAAVIGASTLTGMTIGAGIGSVVPVVGTATVGFVGSVAGAVVGTGIVVYSDVDTWASRKFSHVIYKDSIFGQGLENEVNYDIHGETRRFIDQLEAGANSQMELADHKDLLDEIEDHIIDLQNAETGLAQNLLGSWSSLDPNGDGNITEEEMMGASNSARQDLQFLQLNRELQQKLIIMRTALNTAYDETRANQLTELLDADNAEEVESKLQNDFRYMADEIDDRWQVRMWWNNQDDWRRQLSELKEKIAFNENGAEVFSTAHLTTDEINDLRNDLRDTRDEIEDRIHNLIYEASQGNLSENEFKELQELKTDLDQANMLETVLWHNAAPLNDQAFMPQESVDYDRAREVVALAMNGDTLDRNKLEELLNTAEHSSVIRGRETSMWDFMDASARSLENKVNKLDLDESGYDALSDKNLQSQFSKLASHERSLEDRIHNLMVDAAAGSLNKSEARELIRALELQQTIQTVRAEYQDEINERAGIVTDTTDGEEEQGGGDTRTPTPEVAPETIIPQETPRPDPFIIIPDGTEGTGLMQAKNDITGEETREAERTQLASIIPGAPDPTTPGGQQSS